MTTKAATTTTSREPESDGQVQEDRYHVSRCQNYATLRNALALDRGLILISGKHGSGKTVMLFHALQSAIAQGRTARVENTTPLEYAIPGVSACNSDDHLLKSTIAHLTAGEPVEDIVGVQTRLHEVNGDTWEIITDRLAALTFIAQSRLVIAEFFSSDPLPKDVLAALESPLKPQGIPVIALHLEEWSRREPQIAA